MIALMLMVGCQMMDNPGAMFAPVKIQEAKAVVESIEKENAPIEEEDPLFQDPQEEIALNSEPSAPVVEKDVTEVLAEENKEAIAPEVTENGDQSLTNEVASAVIGPRTDSFRPALVKDGWRPTLIGSMMKGPTPMAVLAMPSGERVVVEAGQLLEEQGVVVMAIGSNYVELAVIQGAEGRASIENLTLTAQF